MPQASQGVQPLVRNEVTQNSPDIQMSGLFASHAEPQRGVSEANRRIAAALRPEMSTHTGFTLYRSAPFGFKYCLLHKEAIQEGHDLGAGAILSLIHI